MTTDLQPPADSETSEPAARRPRIELSRSLIAAGAVITIVAVAAVAFLAVDNHRIRAREQAREAALQAACTYAPKLARYDAKDLDSYFAAVLAGATGSWKTEFDATSKDLRDVLTQGQVVSTVGDVTCAIASADETSATAVAVINQTITSLGTKGAPAPGQLSVSMSLSKDADRWLVSEVSTPTLSH